MPFARGHGSGHGIRRSPTRGGLKLLVTLCKLDAFHLHHVHAER